MKPLEDYLVIKPIEKETTLPSGIVIPDSAKEKPQEGIVVAVGPLVEAVKKMDVVIYKKWEGVEVEEKGETYLLVQYEHLLAVRE
jgi:chaperonin GroES